MKKIVFAMVLGLVMVAANAVPLLAYEDISPLEAYQLATSDANTYIVDVRTPDEWIWVGHPGVNKMGEGMGLDGKVVNIAYKISYRGMEIINPSFLSDIEDKFGENPAATLILMCRSGSRSKAASETLEAAGYVNILNMLTGFEGGKDAKGYRTMNGWVNDGLPYSYSGNAYQD